MEALPTPPALLSSAARIRLQRWVERRHYSDALLGAALGVGAVGAKHIRVGDEIPVSAQQKIRAVIRRLDAQGAERTRSLGPKSLATVVRFLDAAYSENWSYSALAAGAGVTRIHAQAVHTGASGTSRDTGNALVRSARNLLRSSAPLPPLTFDQPSLTLLRLRLSLMPRDIEHRFQRIHPVHAQGLGQIIAAASLVRGEVPVRLRGKVGEDGARPSLERAHAILNELTTALRARAARLERPSGC